MGKHYRFRKLEFWAERGLINLIDERFLPSDDKSFVVIPVREWLLRLKGLNENLHKWDRWPDERDETQNFIEHGVAAAREATKQGRPDDPKAVADILKTKRKVVFPGFDQKSVLHTESASIAPEGLLLPPMPCHPENRT